MAILLLHTFFLFNYQLGNYFEIYLFCTLSVECTFSFARPIFSRIAKKKEGTKKNFAFRKYNHKLPGKGGSP